MKIGVICEGVSDYPAFEKFFGNLLARNGREPKFTRLFPEPDRTKPDGGWGNVLLWLNNNPANVRVARYFTSGLFGGALSSEPYDAILIHLDADALDDDGFRRYVQEVYGIEVTPEGDAHARAGCIGELLKRACEFADMTEADCGRHVLAPAVEATETWCVAAFHGQPADYESLRGADLINAFMSALEQSEGRPATPPYANIDKNPRRRDNFCSRHATGAPRIVAACPRFASAAEKLMAC